MSVRLEWMEAGDPFGGPAVYGKGEQLGDGQRVTSPFALGLGPLVVEGSRDELIGMLDKAYAALGATPTLAEGETEVRVVAYVSQGCEYIGTYSDVPAGVALEVRNYDLTEDALACEPDEWGVEDGELVDEDGERYYCTVYRSGGRESTS